MSSVVAPPEPKPVEVVAEPVAEFIIPTTETEQDKYISGIWINDTTKEEISFSTENKGQAQGWAIIEGALMKLNDSTTEGTAITISTQNAIAIAEVKYARKELTVPAEDAPAEDAPAEDAPAEDAPAEDAPAEDAPAE